MASGTAGFASDPFARARQSVKRNAVGESLEQLLRPDGGARRSAAGRSAQGRSVATQARAAAVARKSAKKKVRYANTSDPAADAAALDLGAGYFPFGP